MATVTYVNAPPVAPGRATTPAQKINVVAAPTAHRFSKPFKHGRANLRGQYTLVIELGFILSLLVVIGIFRLPFTAQEEFEYTLQEQDVVQMEEIQQTHQDQPPPPPPPVPRTVVAVSDDALLEDIELDLDATLDIAEPLADMPPPPPPPPSEVAEEEEEPEVFVVVENPPELIGGLASIQQWIVYPEIAIKAGVEGRVFVEFVVDENGDVLNPVVVKGIGGGCDEAAIEAVLHAKFKPGRQRGKAVRVRYVIPIHFDLTNASS